jgi:hypothetical protein
MILWIGFVAAFMFLSSIPSSWSQDKLPDVQGIPDAPIAVPGTLMPIDGLGARVLDHHGEWTSFFSMSGGSEQILLINGQIENTSGKPLAYVKLQFELLGEDDVVMFRDYGYNRKAEALREEVYEKGQKSLQDMGVEGIDSSAHDTFRFIFFKADVPEFCSHRIRVLQAQ